MGVKEGRVEGGRAVARIERGRGTCGRCELGGEGRKGQKGRGRGCSWLMRVG